MILSDRSIRAELAAGRIVIEPLTEEAIQPSSVDLTVDRFFRVFRNHTTRVIDVKEDQASLTELVEVDEGGAFVLHPGEFALGSTAERVALPDDLVARLEGKSSLGRLGLLIHSSLPATEPVLILQDRALRTLPIGQVVRARLPGSVVAFDPETLAVGYHEITGWYEGPPDRIFEVTLASGRRVRLTAGHNLFTADRQDKKDGRGGLAKVRTGELRPATGVAVPRAIPDPSTGGAPSIPSGLPVDVLVDSDVVSDAVVDVHDTGTIEPVFDLEVRPGGRRIENFLAGHGGVFVSNTAGFVDAGWDGHLTLELSNVANLPITIYPGMRIGQISFLQMTTPADRPYGTGSLGSKYRGQRGPTPSRYFENFRR